MTISYNDICLNCPLMVVIDDKYCRLFISDLISDLSLFSVTHDFEFGRVFENSLYDDNLECILCIYCVPRLSVLSYSHMHWL